MKKFILPIIANLFIFIVLPIYLNTMSAEESKEAWIAVLVAGNAIYFLAECQLYATKYTKGYQLMIINVLFVCFYMQIFLGKIIPLYIVFYSIIMALGLRVGKNRRAYLEIIKNSNVIDEINKNNNDENNDF